MGVICRLLEAFFPVEAPMKRAWLHHGPHAPRESKSWIPTWGLSVKRVGLIPSLSA